MAAINIAFDAPDNASGAGNAAGRPIDLDHIARQTMGDKALELEVLQLFARQARASMKDLSECTGQARSDAAHRLKGSAQAVGAIRVSQTTQTLEDHPDDPAALSAVATAVIEAENFIQSVCR